MVTQKNAGTLKVSAGMNVVEGAGLELKQVFDGINSTKSLKREVLVIHNHPFLALFTVEVLDVWEHRYGYDNLAAVSQVSRHRAALHVEVELLNA